MTRVLVVDDDFLVASIHREYVNRIPGFEVIGEAHTGQQALQLVPELCPDLVLMDIYLPDISGLEVMRLLAGHSAVDFIAVTAARDVDSLRTAMRYGALHYLVKPFTFSMLQERLGRYRSWRCELERTTITGQAEIERLVGTLRTEPHGRTLPKGLCEITLSVIERVVQSSTAELTSIDVSRVAGVSRVTARRYLDFLHRAGRIRMRSQYGSAGRPIHLFTSELITQDPVTSEPVTSEPITSEPVTS